MGKALRWPPSALGPHLRGGSSIKGSAALHTKRPSASVYLPDVMKLRSYQVEALKRIRDAYRQGQRRVLVSLPTGTGKTVIFAHFPTALRMKKRLLILAHRHELLQQAKEKLLAIDPNLTVGIEQAGERASDHAGVVLGSVATLGRRNSRRLARLRPEEFSIIVVDEAHHAVAPTYRRILDHFGLFESGAQRFLIGFTATPRRGDKQGLGDVFEEVCYARDLRSMIEDGYLAPIRGWRVETHVSLDGVRVRHGDFIESQLAAAVDTSARNRLLVLAYNEMAEGRRAIVFCVNVRHAQTVQEAFVAAGIRAEAVWGALSGDERAARLDRFARGETDVMTNCNLLTEGFDQPRVDCIIMARPTRSKLLYAQMVGRGTRLHEDKRDLVVIDIADNSVNHQLPGLHSLLDLPQTLDLAGHDALEVGREVERIQREFPWVDTLQIRTPADLARALTSIDFFNVDSPPELDACTRNVWCKTPGGYRLGLPKGQWLSVGSNLLDGWDVEFDAPGKEVVLVSREVALTAAIRAADRFAAKHFPDTQVLVDRDARWRDREPTDKQRAMVARMGIDLPDGLTRGQLSQVISMAKAVR